MSDFKSALKQGFDAAERAKLARKEIESVLNNLQKDILESSDGKLLISLQQLADHQLGAVFGYPSFFWALVAQNPKVKNSDSRELAKWKNTSNGYPCTITWGDQERQCQNRVALEECLAEMLRTPEVGGILYSLAQLESK